MHTPEVLKMAQKNGKGAAIRTPLFIRKIKDVYDGFGIRKKFLTILTLIFVILTAASLILLQIAFNIYGAQLINETSEILNLYSSNIENELRKVDMMSSNIFSSSQVQTYLSQIDSDIPASERYNQIQDMNSYMLSQADSSVYTFSVTVVDRKNNVNTVGNGTFDFPNDILNHIVNTADMNNGSLVWMPQQGDDTNIIAAREVRSLKDVGKLGDMFIRIDPTSLVSYVSNTSPQYNASLIILNGDEIVYKDSQIQDLKLNIPALMKAKDGVITVGGKKFLINREQSGYSEWTYIYLEPYQYVFRHIIAVRSVLICCYLIVFMVVLLIGFFFADSITKPITVLSKKMKRIKSVNFEKAIDIATDERGDEIGELNNSFVLMLNKIDELIKENYTKQILIKETQLKALQDQINPHFLYNTLDTINWLAIENKQKKISLMVRSLGNLLRSYISGKENIIKVSGEIKLLGDYINIQKVRFGDRLDFRMNINDDVLDCDILKLTLQPIVENSIKYVLENITGVCVIELTSRRVDGHVEIIERDNGPGVEKDLMDKLNSGTYPSKGNGIGLKNIDERLKLFFGEQYGLTIVCSEDGGMTVIIRIPSEEGGTSV
jgi:two-component system, sensor histidine kinase YesM